MTMHIKTIITFLLIFLPLHAIADDAIKIVAFGDSLVEGYGLPPEISFPVKLEKKLKDKGYNVKVINHGVSGNTTADAKARLQAVIEEKPNLVILEFGANDSFRRIPTSNISENLDFIINELKNHNIKVLLCGMKSPLYMGFDYANSFNKIYTDLSDKHDVKLFPFFLKDVAEKPELNLPDMIHPNEKGVDVIIDNIYPYIKKLIK